MNNYLLFFYGLTFITDVLKYKLKLFVSKSDGENSITIYY